MCTLFAYTMNNTELFRRKTGNDTVIHHIRLGAFAFPSAAISNVDYILIRIGALWQWIKTDLDWKNLAEIVIFHFAQFQKVQAAWKDNIIEILKKKISHNETLNLSFTSQLKPCFPTTNLWENWDTLPYLHSIFTKVTIATNSMHRKSEKIMRHALQNKPTHMNAKNLQRGRSFTNKSMTMSPTVVSNNTAIGANL